MKNIEISEKDFIDFRENVLKPCLKENKSVFKTIDYSMENFNTLFPRSRIETPLESVKFGRGKFSKFSLRERRNLISAVYETLTKPDIVLQEERPVEFDEPTLSHNYAKNFAMDKDSKMIQSVVVEIEDESVIITSHERPVNEIVSKIKQADQILYIAPEIGSLIRQHTQNEQSVSQQFLGEILQGRTSSLNKSYSYSEEKSIENLLSEGKLTNKDVLRYGENVGIKAVQKVNYILRKDNKPELDENIFKDASLEELMKCIGDSYGYPEEATNKRKHIAFQTLNRAKVVFEKYSEYITRKVAHEKEIVYGNRIEEIGKLFEKQKTNAADGTSLDFEGHLSYQKKHNPQWSEEKQIEQALSYMIMGNLGTRIDIGSDSFHNGSFVYDSNATADLNWSLADCISKRIVSGEISSWKEINDYAQVKFTEIIKSYLTKNNKDYIVLQDSEWNDVLVVKHSNEKQRYEFCLFNQHGDSRNVEGNLDSYDDSFLKETGVTALPLEVAKQILIDYHDDWQRKDSEKSFDDQWLDLKGDEMSENDKKEYLNLFENEMKKSERQKIDRMSEELVSSIHNIRENETEDSAYSMNFDNSILGIKADGAKEYRLNVSFDGEHIKNYSIDCIHIANGIVSDIDYDVHQNFDESQIKLLEEAKSGISEKIKEYEQKKDISEKFDDKSLEPLWEELEDVPFKENENGDLVLDSSEKWNGFEPGTSRDEIWSWFDKHHSKGINYLVNDYDVENFEKRYDAIGSTRSFIKEKLSAAGIEVVSDKAEFDRILDSAEILQKMQKENNVENLFVSVNNKNLNSEIDKLTINDVNLKDDFIEISKETPFILKECGLNDFPVNMYKQKLARALFLEEQKFGERITHGHKGEFTEKDVKDVFRNISNPRYIFNSKNNISNPNDYYLIAVYDNLDVNKAPMVLSFHFNKNRKEVEANWVTSIYGKRKEILVNDWTKKGFLIYMNDLEMEKAPAEVVTLQMRVSKSASAYINNVNLKSKIVNDLDIAFYKQNNLVYGFAYEGKIYLNPEIATSQVALHEYTHLWDNYTQRANPELWQKGKEIFKNTRFWNDVKSDPNYADIANNEDLLLSEVHAQLCGKMADEILTKIAERDGELTRNSVIDWDKETWSYIKKEIFNTLDIELNDLVSMRDFLSMPMKDLMSEKNISIEKETIDKWDLIEKNYPNYETSKAITLSNDIAMWNEGQNDDFNTVEQFNEREGSFFKSREEILEFGNKLDEQLYKTAYAYMNHMETDELEVSEAMAEKIHEEQKEITITHSVTFPCGFTFPKEIENDYGKKEEYRWKVFEELKAKYGFNENDAETEYFDDKVSPKNDSFNISFAAPVPNDIKKSKEMVENWIKNVEEDLTKNYGAFINWQGGERLEEKYNFMEGFEMKREEKPITESEKSQAATALDVMNYLYSNGDTVEQDVADEIIRIFGERSENLFKDSDGSISILKGNETKVLSPKELCEQSISELDKRLENQNLSYLEKEALESYKNKLNVFAEENLEKYITVSPDKAHERLVELGLEISEECVEAIVSEMDKKWAEEIVENSKGELLWHDKEGEKGYRYDALDVNRLEMLVANTLDSLGDWKERPENRNASETEISRHDSMIKALSENLKSMKVYANLDNAFEIAKRTVDVKKPFNGKNYSAAEKGIYILEAVKRFSENVPESLNKDFEILLKGKDSVDNGIDSLDFVRPDSEQMKIGMENGWDFEDVCKGYVIARSDELPDGVEVIQRIDDMSVFDSDEAAAVQAQADGVKIIPSYKLSFSDNDPMSYYSYVDSPENRELLKDYILSEEEMALNIEIDWFKDRTESEFSLPEQLKDSAQKFDKENLKKWNNPDQPYSVLLTDDITGNHLLVEVKNSLYSTYLFDSSGKFIEKSINFNGYREKQNSDISIDITSSIEAGIITMDEYHEHNLWGDFHKFHINRNKELKENLITVKTDLDLYDKDMWRQRREHAKDYSEEKYLGHILGESFCTTDFKPEVWSYLLEKGADIDEALKTAASDANLGDNLKWLIENAPEKQWERIKNNSSFCKEVMDIAEKSITNDEEFSVEPMLSLAEKIEMETEGIRYCNSLIKEYGGKYDLSVLKDSLNRFTQKDAGRVKAKIAEITSMSFEEAADSKNVDEKTLAKEFAELLNEKDRIEHPDKEEYKHFTADFILCELEKGSSYGQIMATEHPGVSFFDDKEKMKDFQNMSEKEFLKSYSYLSESDYQVTKSVLTKNVYAVYSNIYDALADAEKSVYTGKELKDFGIAVRFICNISADSEFSADTLRKEFSEIWDDTDILRIQSDFNADGIMQDPVYLIHFDKDMNEISSLKMDSLSSINMVQLKRNLRDHFIRFVNKNYDMSVRETFDLEPKPGKVFTTDDAKDFAEILNSYRNNSSEPEISEEIAGCIIEYLEYEDYRVYLEKEKGNLCLYDNSEDYTGHGEIQTVKDIVEFSMEMAYKAKELGYDVYSPESFEKIRNLNDAYNANSLSASLLQAASDEERQSIYMEHYGIPDYAISRKDNILTYYVPAKTEEERYAGYPVKATVNLLNGKETRMSVTEKECHDAHEQYMLENIGRRYISRIKDLLPENERKSVEIVLKAGKLAMKDFSDNDKKYISQFIKNLGATDSDSLGKALNKAVTPISEQKKEKSLKGYEERIGR